MLTGPCASCSLTYMNPTTAAKARTARLAREARPTVYTSETGVPTQRERERAAEKQRWLTAQQPMWDDECRCGDC